jgi:hypothetical protein
LKERKEQPLLNRYSGGQVCGRTWKSDIFLFAWAARPNFLFHASLRHICPAIIQLTPEMVQHIREDISIGTKRHAKWEFVLLFRFII